MSCEKCDGLCVRYQVRSPNDLRKAMSIARENISDGTLVDITEPGAHSASFAEMAANQSWDDIVAWRFKCQQCGEEFGLHAETYHGSGGYWEPVRKGAVRKNL